MPSSAQAKPFSCVVLRYRTKDEFVPPFRVFTYVEEMGEGQLDLVIRVRSSSQLSSPSPLHSPFPFSSPHVSSHGISYKLLSLIPPTQTGYALPAQFQQVPLCDPCEIEAISERCTDTVSASCELEDPNKQSAEYIPRNKQIVWNVGKIKVHHDD